MYTLKEWLKLVMADEPYQGWDGKMLCSESDLEKTQKANVTQGFAACYSFTLVTCGWLRMRYNDRELMIQKDDLYIYSPGLAITILDGSADYQSICLMVDEFTSLESPAVRDMVSLAYMPLVRLSTPTVSLLSGQALVFERRMREMIGYQQSDNAYKDKLLRMLFAVWKKSLSASAACCPNISLSIAT